MIWVNYLTILPVTGKVTSYRYRYSFTKMNSLIVLRDPKSNAHEQRKRNIAAAELGERTTQEQKRDVKGRVQREPYVAKQHNWKRETAV